MISSPGVELVDAGGTARRRWCGGRRWRRCRPGRAAASRGSGRGPLQVVDGDALDDDPVDADRRDRDAARPARRRPAARASQRRDRRRARRRRRRSVPGRRRGRRGRGRGRSSSSARLGVGELGLELVLEPVLGLGVRGAGAPQLVGDEQQDQDAGGDQRAADGAEDPCERTAATVTGAIPAPGVASERTRRRRRRTGARVARRPVRYRSAVAMEPVVHLRAAVVAARPLPRPRRRRPRRRAAARSCSSRGPTGPARPPCCAPAPAWCRSSTGEAVVLGHDLRPRPPAGAPPRRPARPRHRLYDDLTVADNVRFWARAAGRDRPTPTPPWPASASTAGWPTCRVARLSAGQRRRTSLAALRRPPPRAVAARRAPRRPRPGRPRPGRRPHRATPPPAGATVLSPRHELDRASAARRPDGHHRPAASSDRPPVDARPRARSGGRPCSVTPASSRARTCGSSGASRVTTNQVAPFAVLVLVLFAFALDPDRGVLDRATAGLFWVAVLFCRRSSPSSGRSRVEAADGIRDALRLSGLDPAGIFLGKAGAVAVAAARPRGRCSASAWSSSTASTLDRASALLVVDLRRPRPAGWPPPVRLYGVLAAGLRVRETLLPLLLLPVLAPVLIGATRAFEAALGGVRGRGLAVGRAARRLRRRLRRLRARRLRPPAGGIVSTATRRPSPHRTTPGHGAPACSALTVLGRARHPGPARARGSARPTRSRATPSALMYVHVPVAIIAYRRLRRHRGRQRHVPLEEVARGWDLRRRRLGRDRRRVHGA